MGLCILSNGSRMTFPFVIVNMAVAFHLCSLGLKYQKYPRFSKPRKLKRGPYKRPPYDYSSTFCA